MPRPSVPEDQMTPKQRYASEYYLRNRLKILEVIKSDRKANPEKYRIKDRRHYSANSERHSRTMKTWRKANPEACTTISAKRRALKRQAILPTTDFDLIKKIYQKRLSLSKEYGEEYHVDHIIPLDIGGAHHQDNLRIITAKENMKKHNKYIPELGGVWADNDLARETKKELGI
jgi:5-methylcytosine-specific restriction endonuclease McrA